MALGAINPPCIRDHSTPGQRALSSQVSKEEMIRGDGFMTVGGGGVVPTLSQYFADYRGTWTRSSASPRPLTRQRPTCLDQSFPKSRGFPTLHLLIHLDQAAKACQEFPGRKAKMRHRPRRGRGCAQGALGRKHLHSLSQTLLGSDGQHEE